MNVLNINGIDYGKVRECLESIDDLNMHIVEIENDGIDIDVSDQLVDLLSMLLFPKKLDKWIIEDFINDYKFKKFSYDLNVKFIVSESSFEKREIERKYPCFIDRSKSYEIKR